MSFIAVVKLPKGKKGCRNAIECSVCEIYNFLKLKKSMYIHIKDYSKYNDAFCGFYEYDGTYHRIEINDMLFHFKTPILLFKTICHEIWHAHQSEKKKKLDEKNALKNEKRLYKMFYKNFRKRLNSDFAWVNKNNKRKTKKDEQ